MKHLLLAMVILLGMSSTIAIGEEPLSIEPKTILKVSDMEAFAGDGIGYKIVNIGDLDNNGVEDLATIAYHSVNGYSKDNDSDLTTKYGALIILFMDDSGSVLNSKRITIDNNVNGLGYNCLDDPTRENKDDDILARDSQSLESLAYLGNFINGNPTLVIGYPSGDFKGEDSNSGDVLLVEISTNGDVNSCSKLTQLPGYSNGGTIGKELSFGLPVLTTDVDADGMLDLIVGNAGHSMFGNDYGITDLLVFLLDDDGTIKNTKANSGMHLGMTLYEEGLESGSTINGESKIALGLGDEKGGDDGFIIVNMLSDGSLFSSSKIDESTINYFGFDVDFQQNHPNLGNDTFDSDDDIDGTSDGFGNALLGVGDLNGDDNNDLIIGAFNDDSPVNDAGAIYFILLNEISDSPDDVFKLSNPNIISDDSFGHGIASFSDNETKWLAVGAYLTDTEGTDSGVIYIYDFEDFPFYEPPLTIPVPTPPDPPDEETPKENSTLILNNSVDSNLDSTYYTSDKVANVWLRNEDNFTHGINYLIISGTLHGDKIRIDAEVPHWVVNSLSEFWYKGEIDDLTFYNALQYILDKQIIK